jgi:hypothetical protein
MEINPILKKTIGFFLITGAVMVTIVFVKRLPPIMKLMVLAADVITIYYAVQLIKNKKQNKKLWEVGQYVVESAK